jgi:hypothetical protein
MCTCPTSRASMRPCAPPPGGQAPKPRAPPLLLARHQECRRPSAPRAPEPLHHRMRPPQPSSTYEPLGPPAAGLNQVRMLHVAASSLTCVPRTVRPRAPYKTHPKPVFENPSASRPPARHVTLLALPGQHHHAPQCASAPPTAHEKRPRAACLSCAPRGPYSHALSLALPVAVLAPPLCPRITQACVTTHGLIKRTTAPFQLRFRPPR